MIRLIFSAALVFMPLALAPVFAQETLPSDRPGLFDPGLDRQDRQQRERELELRDQADRIEVPALKGGDVKGQTLPESDQRFVLKSIGFNPSVFIDEERLESIAENYVDRRIGFADLNAMLDEINSIYQSQRQLTSRAVIPPQDIGDGHLAVVLVEAELESVRWIKDPRHVSTSFYTDRVTVQTGEVLDTASLLDEVRGLNATTPGPQLSVNLEPGEEFGTTRLALEPFEPDPWGLRAQVNNYGSESSGEDQLGLRGAWFSPTGNADSLSVALQAAEGTLFGDIGYRFPVNRHNGVVYGGLSRNQLEIINGPYRNLEIEGESWEYRLGYEHPLWLNRRWTLIAGGEYRRSRSETTVEGDVTLTETTVDSVRLNGVARFREGDWFVQYEQSLDVASADNAVTRDSGNYQRLIGNGFGQWRWRDDIRFVGRSRWQYASAEEDLPSTLLFQLGGLASVRGYDSGILSAPHGIDLALEGYWAFADGWEGSIMFDAGHALDDDLPETTIASIGAGFSYRWSDSIYVDATYAHALTEVVPEQESGQLLVQLEWRL